MSGRTTSLADPEVWEAIDTLLSLDNLDVLPGHVRAELRGLRLAGLLMSGGRWSVRRMAAATGMGHSSAHRRLDALVAAGMAELDRGRGYRAVQR